MNEKSIQQRLNNIAGQIQGINKMIERGDDCVSVITQMKAVKSAMSATLDKYVQDNAKKCIDGVKLNDSELLSKLIKELSSK